MAVRANLSPATSCDRGRALSDLAIRTRSPTVKFAIADWQHFHQDAAKGVMDRVRSFERSDVAIAVFAFTVSLALRVPFRTQFAYHWDSVQYALAISDYRPTQSQPQAPGYLLYVMLGRLVNLFVHDPHASLVWMSVVSGAALAAIGYLLGAAMFGRGSGWATAVILATSPLCWFHSEVALMFIVDAALVAGTVLTCWLAVREKGSWGHVVALSVLFTLVAGVRQQSAPVLLPAWVYAFSKMARPRWPKFVVGVALTTLLCLAWFVPMVQMSGGLASYWATFAAMARFDAPKTLWRGGVTTLWRNVDLIIAVCWAGLLTAGLIATWFLARPVILGNPRERQRFFGGHRRQLQLLTLWIIPMLAFGVTMFMSMAGYVLGYFPGLALVAGAAIGQVKKGTNLAMLLLLIATVNCAAFFSLGHWTTRLMLGLPLTAVDLRQHDRGLAEEIALIRREFDPKQVVICHGCQHLYWGFRHFQYYLPEYQNLLLDPDVSMAGDAATKFWLSENGQTAFVDEIPLHSHRTVVLVVPPAQTLSIFQRYLDVSGAEAVSDSAGMLFTLRDGSARQ